MKSLLILGCSARKIVAPGEIPALSRYDGPAFRVLRRALRERAGLRETLTTRIVSAEFGLILDSTPIPWYDRTMTEARAGELYLQVQHAINGMRPLPPRRFISVGAAYAMALPPIRATYATGGQGERLGQLKAWLWTMSEAEQTLDRSDP